MASSWRLCPFLSLKSSLRRQCDSHSFANVLSGTRSSSSGARERVLGENGSPREHTNAAALEKGSTMCFNNRNPRSLELLGVAEKPKGFITKNQRVDYYHRYA